MVNGEQNNGAVEQVAEVAIRGLRLVAVVAFPRLSAVGDMAAGAVVPECRSHNRTHCEA